MATRHEITKKYAWEYKRASKKDKGRMLDELVAATIDRLLKPTKEARYPAVESATRPGATLRSSIVVRRAMDKMEQAPGFLEIDMVAHCGHSLKGEHAWTLTATDVYLGLDREHRYRYWYDTPEELALLNELWGYVNLRKNLFLATKKANGWRSTKAGRNTRTYDKPKTPYQRLREETGFLGDDAEHRLQLLDAQINPADPTRNINRILQALILPAKDKTLTLRDQVS